MTRQTTRLEVVADGEKWAVREHGIGRLTSHADKSRATKAARAVAANHPPCELTIRNDDGTIESQETFHSPVK
ncbi:MAG TPA: DUF2188 domain-containing protein [Longimicrobiales bacterium]